MLQLVTRVKTTSHFILYVSVAKVLSLASTNDLSK